MAHASDRIAPTAYYTAYVWHRLGLPRSELFRTYRGAALYWGFLAAGEWVVAKSGGTPTQGRSLEVRHRSIEHALERYRPDTVVELGAGLSRRGVSWALDRGVRYVEVDLPAMVDEKLRLLRARGGPALLERLAPLWELRTGDLLDEGLSDLLRGALQGAHRPAVVTEGVLSYYRRPEQTAIVRRVAQALRERGTGRYITDLRIHSDDAAEQRAVRVLRAGIRLATSGRGAGEELGSVGEVESMFLGSGFDEARPVRPAEVPGMAGRASLSSVWEADVSG